LIENIRGRELRACKPGEAVDINAFAIFMEKDCNVAALGVYRAELNSQPRRLLGILVGTSIRAGMILDGKLCGDLPQVAGDLGHMIIAPEGPPCPCGQRGCLQAVASRAALFQRLTTAVKEGQETLLIAALGPDLRNMRNADLRKALRHGDTLVKDVAQEAASYLGLAVANLARPLRPEEIVLVGGFVEALAEAMFPVLEETVRKHSPPGTIHGVKIMISNLGDGAILTGAAVLARQFIPPAVGLSQVQSVVSKAAQSGRSAGQKAGSPAPPLDGQNREARPGPHEVFLKADRRFDRKPFPPRCSKAPPNWCWCRR
jgi:predicted NBD/HSP70 family sugar kinase